MLILGIDPGSRHTGFALIESRGGTSRLVHDGRLSYPARLPLWKRLAALSRDLDAMVTEWQPQAAAIETPFHGINSKSLIVLAQARGAILAVVGDRDIEIQEYSPATIKVAVAGNGRADKSQVSKMVHVLLSLESADRSEDQTDAIAVALCFARRYRMDRITAERDARKLLR